MDKKLNRQIGYRPNKSVSETLEEKANVHVKNINTAKPNLKPKIDVSPKIPLTPSQRTENLYKWISSRPLLNLNALCQIVGIDRANFVKGMGKDRGLKTEILDKFIAQLKLYGYAE